jgi:D-amino-acid dehydrogenase
LAGGWHYAGDAHLRPDRLMASWRALLADRGVEFREGCEFLGFVGDRPLRAVATSTGEIPANAAVVATGAWTPLLNKHLGCKVPIQPGKGYSVTLPRPAKCPTIPLIFEEHRVAVTPMQSGYRVGSTMEFAGYDETLNRQRIDLLLRGAAHYLEPAEGPAAEEWWGWRPMVYDGKPVIGPSPARPDVLIAAGHGMLGLSMATGTGKLVAELLTGTTPHVDPAHYAATRF